MHKKKTKKPVISGTIRIVSSIAQVARPSSLEGDQLTEERLARNLIKALINISEPEDDFPDMKQAE